MRWCIHLCRQPDLSRITDLRRVDDMFGDGRHLRRVPDLCWGSDVRGNIDLRLGDVRCLANLHERSGLCPPDNARVSHMRRNVNVRPSVVRGISDVRRPDQLRRNEYMPGVQYMPRRCDLSGNSHMPRNDYMRRYANVRDVIDVRRPVDMLGHRNLSRLAHV